MDALKLELLGKFRAFLGPIPGSAEPLESFRTNKVQALLIYLAVETEAHSRESLTSLLWPGMPDRSARANLRQIVYYLRKIIPELEAVEDGESPDQLLFVNRQSIQLNPAADVVVDARQFEDHLAASRSHDHVDLLSCAVCREDLLQAAELYRDDFLEDFYLEDAVPLETGDNFEEWAQVKREAYRRQALDALEILAAMHLRQKEYPAARIYADRQLEIDNLRESAYRQLMEILALSGQRAEAMAVYDVCRRLLAEELGMAPSKRTTELYDQILAGDLSFESGSSQAVRGYDLQDEIGEGAFGSIYRAIQPSINREVAVKVIRRKYANNPEFIRRFEFEAQTIAHLEHPHIVPLYDYWRDPDGAYLVMRYLRGGNLLTALETGPWDTEATAEMLDQLAQALGAIHQQGIVHRDIKPANILLDEDGNAYLSDFGIAKDLLHEMQLTVDGGMVGSPDYISPEQILSDSVTAQTDIYSLGAVLYEMLTGERPFADSSVANLIYKHLNEPIAPLAESRPDLPLEIDEVIQRATAKQPADRYATALEMAAAFRAAVQGISGEAGARTITPMVTELYNPYKGLRAFQEADVDDFYGREGLVEQLISGVADSRFLAVVGPSGSGKSSAVKAGLIPALRKGVIPARDNQASSDKWFVAEMTPGAHPLDELELALWPIAVDPPPSLVEPMRHDIRGLSRTIRRILPDEEGAHAEHVPQLLLFIDQFEELFTLVEDEEQREFFIDSLLTAIRDPRSPLRVVVTLRADFYDRPLQIQSLGKLLKENTEIVLPMSAEELTWAVREPARRMGVRLEPGLAEAIVTDVSDQPGGLPLLQFALTEMFEQRHDRQMTRESYHTIGGVTGALGRRADEIYGELDEAGQAAARQLFLRLVTLGEGVEDTRRRVLRSELEGIGEEQLTANDGHPAATMAEVIDAFGAARLLTFDYDPVTREPTVEVAHEALLREWRQLRSWLDESRSDVRTLRMLSLAAADWQESGQENSYLLRGSRLELFAGWAAGSTIAMTESERVFLESSVARRAERQAQEEARHQQELETAQKLAETEKARAEAEEKRAAEQALAAGGLRRRAYILGGVLVIAVLLAIAAFFFAQQSSQNATVAEKNAAIAATHEAEAVAEADQRATAQAQAEIESQRADAERDAAVNAQATAVAEGVRADDQRDAALAAEDEADDARVAAEEQAEIARFNEAQARSLALISSAREVRTGGDVDLALALAVQAVDMEQPPGEAVRTLSDLAFVPGSRHIHENESATWIIVLGTIPDGAPLFSVSPSELTADVWANYSGELLSQFSIANGDGRMTNPIIMPDSTRLTVAYTNGEVIVWDWSTGEKVQTLLGVDITNWANNFAGPDGQTVVTIGRYGGPETEVDGLPEGFRMIAWDIESGEQIYRYDGVRGERMIEAVSTPDNRIALISASLFDEQAENTGLSRLLIVDLETGEILTEPALAELDGNNYIEFLRTNPAGDQAFAIITDIDNPDVVTGVFMSLPSGEVETTVALDTDVSYATYSPDGSQFVVDRFDGKVHFTLLDAITGKEIRRLGGPTEGHTDGTIYSRMVDFTPDGKRLVSGGDTGDVLLWDVETGELLQRLLGHSGTHLTSVKVSPDGQTAITGGGNGRLHFWDITQSAAAQVFEEHQFRDLPHVTVSPDGTQAVSTAWDSPNGEIDEAILWDTNTLEVIHRLPGTFITAHFLPDGRSVILGGIVDYIDFQSQLVHWDIESGEVLGRKMIPGSMFFYDLDVSSDGTSILFVDNTNVLYHYDIETLSNIKTITLSKEAEWLYSVIYSPDGHSALAGGDAGDLILLNLESGEEIQRYPHGGTATGLAFSEDGERLVSVGGNQTIVLWDVASGEVIRTFNGHSGEVTSVAYTPDESQLISASGDGTLILWDVASGEALRTFSEHSAYINEVALSPDGQLAYSAANDGTVIVRPIAVLSVDELLAHIADNRVLRDFTCEEREQFRILPLCVADGVVPE